MHGGAVSISTPRGKHLCFVFSTSRTRTSSPSTRLQFFSQTLTSQWIRSEACSAEATRAVPSSSKARLEGRKTMVIRVRNSSPLHLDLNLTFQRKSSQANHSTLQDSTPSRRSSAEGRSTPSKHVESTRRSPMVPETCSRRRLGE